MTSDDIAVLKEAIRVLDTVPFDRAKNAKLGLLNMVEDYANNLFKEIKHLEFEVKHFGVDKQHEIDTLYSVADRLTAWVSHYAN